MKANQPNDKRDHLDLDENDPVWQLLGESPRPEPDAWFATRTLARCRETGLALEARAIFFGSALWRWALGGGLGVCLAVFLLVPQKQAASIAPADQKKVQDAFAVLASISPSDADADADSTSTTSSSWQDSSSL